MFTNLLILVPAALVFVVLVLLSRRSKTRRGSSIAQAGPPRKAIIVDGSNVIHWSGTPSMKVLKKVLSVIEKRGFAPIVYFDASVGYQIGDRYLGDQALSQMTGVQIDRIRVVDKGVVADEMILTFATEHGLRIVTNDRYRDWRGQFPHAARKGTLVSGQWKSGNPTLRF